MSQDQNVQMLFSTAKDRREKPLSIHDRSGIVNGVSIYGIAKNIRLDVTAEEREIDSEVVVRTRCDSDIGNGPVGFHYIDEDTGVCNCGSTEELYELSNSHLYNIFDIEDISIVLGNHSHSAYIVRISLNNKDLRNKVIRSHWSTTTSTLQECIKLLIEWSQAYDYLGCRDEIAVVCKKFVDELDMPDDVKDWFSQNIPDNKVARFIRGDVEAREPVPVPAISGTMVEQWVVEKLVSASIMSIPDDVSDS